MKEHSAVFYIDASVRFITNRTSFLNTSLLRDFGIMLFSYSPIITYAMTDPGMYKYLPTDRSMLQQQRGIAEANSILYYNTKEVFDEILYWHFLCSLDASCIAPPGSFSLPHMPSRWERSIVWAGIHRYDQSAINILLFNFLLKRNMTMNFAEGVLGVRRDDVSSVNVSTCNA